MPQEAWMIFRIYFQLINYLQPLFAAWKMKQEFFTSHNWVTRIDSSEISPSLTLFHRFFQTSEGVDADAYFKVKSFSIFMEPHLKLLPEQVETAGYESNPVVSKNWKEEKLYRKYIDSLYKYKSMNYYLDY